MRARSPPSRRAVARWTASACAVPPVRDPRSLSSFESLENRPDLLGELGCAALDDVPHDVRVRAEVTVHEDLAHPDRAAPANLGMPLAQLRRDVRRSFADDHDPVHRGREQDWIPAQAVCLVRDVLAEWTA